MLKTQLAPWLLSLFALALAGEASAAVTINVWHAYRGKEAEALDKVAATFNGANKDLQIKLLQIPYDAFADKVTASIPRGKGPDLFIFAQDRIGDWAASGLIEAVDFWLTDDLKKAYLPPTLEAITYDDSVYGLPMAFKMVSLFYNTKLVSKPPVTTDELIAVAKKATDVKKGQYGLAYENANFYYHAAWMQGFGGRVFDKSGAPVLSTPEVIASMEFARNLAKKEGVMPQEITSTLVTTLFNRGQAAMVINGPWFMGEIDKGVTYKVALLPVLTANKKPAAPFLTAEAVIMSAKASDKKAAFEVMKYLTSVEAGKVMATVGRQTTARKDVYSDPAVAGDELLAVFKKQLETSLPMPNTPAMRMVWSPATTAMNKVINSDAPIADIMKTAQDEVAKLVKGARR
ncbi:MAG: extracellular solute-binding protein [Deltaproteobacteria bacterium]|nr:extracellular solute-binding protein [Deltaproteobacteria bacterium]